MTSALEMPPVEIIGDRLSVCFDRFDQAAYQRFLQVKRLPEYELAFDHENESYTVTAPKRFATMLDRLAPDVLSPGDILGGEADRGKLSESGVYIYALIDPRTNKLRYIGKSIRPRQRRQNHFQEVSNCHRSHWIQELRRAGLRPLALILERLDESADWQAAERDWIAFGRSIGWPLVNNTDGGDGVPGLPPEVRERIASVWRGKKLSPEHCAKIGAASRGRKHTESNKRRMSDLMKNRYFSPTHRARLSAANRKFSVEVASEIRRRLQSGEIPHRLAKEFKTDPNTIRAIRDFTGPYTADREVSS